MGGAVAQMKTPETIDPADAKALYDGWEGDLFELFMGQQIHIGGFGSSMDLAERAMIGAGQHGVDLCCCNGAGMRFLVRFREVTSMLGVDASRKMVERGRRSSEEEGLAERIRFVIADACESGLPDASSDFVWSEDAWCYVADKGKLIAEAARIVKPGGVIAFTDWIEGPSALDHEEAERFLGFMRFDNVEDVEGYRRLLGENGCQVLEAEDTGRFPDHMDLFINMLEMQLTYDALRILDFHPELLGAVTDQLKFLLQLARAGKIAQGRFIARRT